MGGLTSPLYSCVDFDKCVGSCKHCHNQDKGHFHCPPTSYPHGWSLPPPSPPANTDLLPAPIILLLPDCLAKWLNHLAFVAAKASAPTVPTISRPRWPLILSRCGFSHFITCATGSQGDYQWRRALFSGWFAICASSWVSVCSDPLLF